MSLFQFTHSRRAETRILQYKQHLDARFPDPESLVQTKRTALDEIRKLLGYAEEALVQDKTELAWQHYHSALRSELKLDSEASLKFKIEQLRNESTEKLSDWRSKTVLVSLENADDTLPETDTVIEGYRVLHDHFSNVYLKNRNILFQLTVLSGILFFFLLVFFGISWSGHLLIAPVTDESTQITTIQLLVAAIMGIFGACLSATFSLSRGIKGVKIPQQQINLGITLSRPLVGAVSAIVIYFFAVSELVFPNQSFNAAGYLSISFVAGFSERLVIYAVSIWSSGDRKNP